MTRRDVCVFRTGMKACKGNGPYVPLLSPSISIGRRSFVTAMNQWVREGKAWKRGRSVVGIGFRRSYVPQVRAAME